MQLERLLQHPSRGLLAPYLFDDIAHRRCDHIGRVIANAMPRIRHDDLAAARRKSSQTRLQVVDPHMLKFSSLFRHGGIVGRQRC